MKYNNTKTIFAGRKFDSKKEAKRAHELQMLQMAGEISNLEYQTVFQIEHNGVKICKYVVDFTYIDRESPVVEDVKSEFTRKLPVYRLKKKLMKAFYSIDILET